MLVVQNVKKFFGKTKIIDSVSLEVKRGDIYGLLGPNGSGKTTLVRMIVGLIPPDAGDIYIEQKSIISEPDEAKKLVGFVPDVPYLYEKLTGREFLQFICELWNYNKNSSQKIIEKFAKIFRLEPYMDNLIKTYSLGTKQKISLCAALVHEPSLLVLDEPLTGIDPQTSKEIRDIIKSFAEAGGAVLLTTHFLDVAEKLCNRLGFLKSGILLRQVSIEDIKKYGSLESYYLSVMGTDDDEGKK
ncbi:MAG: type transport system ATP-binding protein [Eubacteriales bacterium]|nr:type transport system ATP-binding protein [Eubacteriales bacterium]